LIKYYKSISDEDLRERAGWTLRKIENKDYIEDYLELITKDEYTIGCSGIISLLCKLKERRAVEPMLKLLQNDPKEFRWTVIASIWRYRDPQLIPYIEPFLKADKGEIRSMAKRTIERLNKKTNR
jgi:HEAT repeat protein